VTCRAALREIDLHFHDLRREFACTLLESSAGMHDVQKFLGHANITTTSRYLESSPVRLVAALARMEGEDETAANATASDVCTSFAQPGASADSGATKSVN